MGNSWKADESHMGSNNKLPENFKIRIKDEEHSRLVQQWLFDNDVAEWAYGCKTIQHKGHEFLFVESNVLTLCSDEEWFCYKPIPEVVFDVITTISPRVVQEEQEVEIFGKKYIVKDKEMLENALKSVGIVEKEDN